MIEAAPGAHRLAGTRVLVAGAGLAGLSAACALEADGAEVTVVEARDRVGGRVWTIRDGFDGRQHAEGGADIIERGQAPVIELARSLGLETVSILEGGFAFYGPRADGRLAIQSQERMVEELTRRLQQDIERFRVDEGSWDGVIARALGSRSVADWHRAHPSDPYIAARIRALRGLFLAEPEDMSLLQLIEFLAEESMGVDTGALRIRGGNDQLATGLVKRLRRPPQLRSVLRAVSQSDGVVTAVIDAPAGRAEWRGDYLISAVPATTLTAVGFDPPMHARQRQALTVLRYGCATRVLLQFDDRFWRRPGRARAFGSDRVHGALWEGNEEQRGTAGILSLLAGGDASAEISALMERNGPDAVVEQLNWLGKPARLLASRVIRWEDDPWAKGGYAYFPPEFDPALRGWLARPHGRVLFAGEHTSGRWQGYLSGAVESGLRAAAEVVAIEFLGGIPMDAPD